MKENDLTGLMSLGVASYLDGSFICEYEEVELVVHSGHEPKEVLAVLDTGKLYHEMVWKSV